MPPLSVPLILSVYSCPPPRPFTHSIGFSAYVSMYSVVGLLLLLLLLFLPVLWGI